MIVEPSLIEEYIKTNADQDNSSLINLKKHLSLIDLYTYEINSGNFVCLIVSTIFLLLFIFLPAVASKIGCAAMLVFCILLYYKNKRLNVQKKSVSEDKTLTNQLRNCQEYIHNLKKYFLKHSFWCLLGIYFAILMIGIGSNEGIISILILLVTFAVAFIMVYRYEVAKYKNILNAIESDLRTTLNLVK